MNKKGMDSEEGEWEGGWIMLIFYCSYISWS